MGNTNQKFQVRVETGEILEAELLSIVEIDCSTIGFDFS